MVQKWVLLLAKIGLKLGGFDDTTMNYNQFPNYYQFPWPPTLRGRRIQAQGGTAGTERARGFDKAVQRWLDAGEVTRQGWASVVSSSGKQFFERAE